MTNKCFLSLVIKALGIKRKFKLYTAEKEFSKAGHDTEEINRCLGTHLSESFNRLLNAPKKVKPGFFNRFLIEESVENFILKSVFGFLGGILLTYICFMFLVFSLNFTLKRATYICIGLGVILSLGLAFSVKIRCTVFLCIPQLFSKRGRQALLAYAFILALSGPAKNTLHNVEVMSESLACTQEQLKQAENDLLKCAQKPNAAAKKTIEKLLEKINSAVKDFKNLILQLYKNCFDILETVLHAQKWLYSITFLCHKKTGKPAHRCLSLLDEATENCKQIFSSVALKDHCEIHPYRQEMICSTNTKFVCLKSDVPECLPVKKLQNQLEAFKHRAMHIFYVSLEAHQTYSQSNRSYTYHEEYQGMATEIRQKTDQFLQYFDFMSVIFGIFILVLFVKVIIYRHKFLTEDHYDNRYITSDFVDIDNTRAAFQMETLLPLAPRERMQYIKVTSVRLVPCERIRLLSSFVFLIFATFKIIIHMLTDSSLYWILSTVRRNERLLYMTTLEEEEPMITVRVVGDGLVAELFRNVTGAVKRESSQVRLDPTPCLPDPVPPDWNRYYQILALVLICWLFALCEPYGLRLRHSVMVTYHPDRARERAIWLYNKIISNRISFIKVSRRHLRRQYKDVWIEDTCRYKFMRKTSSQSCLLCKTTIGSLDGGVRCNSPGCMGIYCTSCFSCLKFCSICRDPAEYGDMSDVSEEKDSSEEEFQERSPRKRTDSGRNKPYRDKRNTAFSQNLKQSITKLLEKERKPRTKKSASENLIQPTLLCKALRYCRSKIPTFNKLKTLSDVESSDWDHDSSVGGNWRERKRSCKRKDPVNTEGGRKTSKGKRTRRKEEADEGGSSKGKQNVPKVCLFRKVSPQTSARSPARNSFETDARQIPDFCFKDEMPECNNVQLMRARDSVEIAKAKCRKYSGRRGKAKKCDSGVLVNEEVMEKEIGEAKFQSMFCTSTVPVQLLAEPLVALEAKHSGRSTKSPRKLPFIDPNNVHEIDLGMDTDEEQMMLKGGGDGTQACRKGVTGNVRLPFTPSHTRICYGNTESSESENTKICTERDVINSSSESEGQFYYRPYRSAQSFLLPDKSKSDVKKASGKLNLKTLKHSDSYAVETDSSNENFLSVKPSRKTDGGEESVYLGGTREEQMESRT